MWFAVVISYGTILNPVPKSETLFRFALMLERAWVIQSEKVGGIVKYAVYLCIASQLWSMTFNDFN